MTMKERVEMWKASKYVTENDKKEKRNIHVIFVIKPIVVNTVCIDIKVTIKLNQMKTCTAVTFAISNMLLKVI